MNKNNFKYLNQIELNLDEWHYEQYMDLYAAYKKQEIKEGLSLELGNSGYRLVPGLNIVAGMTGHGKSMLGNSIAFRAIRDGLNVLYITLEVSKENTFYQMLSLKSFFDYGEDSEKSISHSTIKNRQLNKQQENFVFNELWPKFKEMPGNLHILTEWDFDTNSSVALQQRLMTIEEYAIKQTGHGIDLMIVDYIQLFKNYSDSAVQGEYSVLTKWTNDFRKMSLNYLGEGRSIPIVLLSQLNRDAWNEEQAKLKAQMKKDAMSKFPSKSRRQVAVPEIALSISQIAGCAEIAKAADQIFTIYSDESYKASNQCLISVLKCRNGKTTIEPFATSMWPQFYCVGNTGGKTNYFDGNLDDILGIQLDSISIDEVFGDLPAEIL